MAKRGLSDVVTTVLIILLVLAAVAIIWSFLGGFLQSSSETIQSNFASSIKLSVMPQSVSIQPILRAVSFNVKREPGMGAITGITAVIEDSSGSKYTKTFNTTLNELESQKFTVYYGTSIGTPKKITVVPKTKTDSGKEVYANSLSYGILDVSNSQIANPDGLVGYWNFDNDFKDYSGNNNLGTQSGGVTFVPGKVGQAAHFTGSQYVIVPNFDYSVLRNGKESSSWTISAWVHPN
jgi:hypothetical protein